MTTNVPVDCDIIKRMVDFDALPPEWRSVARDYPETELVAVIQSGIRDPDRARRRLEFLERTRKLWEVGDG